MPKDLSDPQRKRARQINNEGGFSGKGRTMTIGPKPGMAIPPTAKMAFGGAAKVRKGMTRGR